MSDKVNSLRFLWNGIKATDGRLQKCNYSNSELISFPAGTITIYGRDYERFSAEVHAAFTVENDTDHQTDYFEDSKIRVVPSHPLYSEVAAALAKHAAHNRARADKWTAKHTRPAVSNV